MIRYRESPRTLMLVSALVVAQAAAAKEPLPQFLNRTLGEEKHEGDPTLILLAEDTSTGVISWPWTFTKVLDQYVSRSQVTDPMMESLTLIQERRLNIEGHKALIQNAKANDKAIPGWQTKIAEEEKWVLAEEQALRKLLSEVSTFTLVNLRQVGATVYGAGRDEAEILRTAPSPLTQVHGTYCSHWEV